MYIETGAICTKSVSGNAHEEARGRLGLLCLDLLLPPFFVFFFASLIQHFAARYCVETTIRSFLNHISHHAQK